jgi:CDP-glycerol glycerophosphotransferase
MVRRLALRTGIVRSHDQPLVTVVVPVFDVERYLAACLQSLATQTHDNLQVVMVDDGSPDRSIDVMLAYARRDDRFEIIRQANAGPGAARNTGAKAARGTYLMFVDSDDTLERDAVATHVLSLEVSRSDFSVAPYRRFNRSGRWPAAWWIKQAHERRRRRVTLAGFPDIQVNAVVWSKCFRRRFWEHHGLSFPAGVLYEDQTVSSRAYALARTFDVQSHVIYNWRVREDQTSITQQITEARDLRFRLAAAEASLGVLEEHGQLGARDARLIQFLRHDLQHAVKAAQHGDDEYWQVLRRGLDRLTRHVTPEVWTNVSVQQRIGIRLVLEDLRRETTWFTGLGRSTPKHSPAIAAGGRLHLDTPARHILGLPPTDPELAFADYQLSLVTSIRRICWTDDGMLCVTGWAYVDNVSLAEPATAFSLRLWAEHPDRMTRISLPVRSTPSPEVTGVSKHRYANYERSVFQVEVDPRELIRHSDVQAPVRWRLVVEVSAAGIVRSGPLRGRDGGGSAARPTARFFGDVEAVPRYSPRTGLRVDIAPIRCEVESAGVVDRVLSVRVRGRAGFVPNEIEITFRGERGRIRQPLTPMADDRAWVELVLPSAGPDERPDGVEQGLVRIVSLEGERAPAALRAPEVLIRQRYRSQHAARTEYGNLCVLDEYYALRVHHAEVTSDHRLTVVGTVVGLRAEDITVVVGSPKAEASGPARPTTDGQFTASIQLDHDPWGLGRRPLPSGRYRLTAHAVDRFGVVKDVPVRAEQALIDRLPFAFANQLARATLRRARRRRLRLDLEPPLTRGERGARPQQRLQNQLAARRSRPRSEPGAVLFRSYYGEIAGCNQLAVHRELVRRGTGHRLYWAVKDHSVRVPEGGIPVIHDSAEWYRLLHEAEFYLDNMHQPIYHRKPSHQVQVQTFHGYPFKQMGFANWARQRREQAHIQSYVERAEDWDFLVSPATYGTEPLRTAFGFPNEVLEIGYPRNDVLLGAAAEQIRMATRRRLGIRPDQTALLYAPTFRDHLARNDFAAAMVDFLDLQLLSAALGPTFVILVRGHAFNARRSERIGSFGHVVDVTDYPEVNALILASDAGICDYSSIRFDYGLTGKPMIFLVPDLEDYLSEIRGAILPYEPTAPGPLLHSTDDVISAVVDLPRVQRDYAGARATFRRRFLDLDDGHAAERLVDRVFLR